MSPDRPRPPDDEEPDLGAPVVELQRLIAPLPERFLSGLRNKIGRRSLTAQVLGLTWVAPKLIVVELLRVVFDLFDPGDRNRGDSK